MKHLYLLFSHALTEAQKADAVQTFGVDAFKPLPDKLQALWSNVPVEFDAQELVSYLEPIAIYLNEHVNRGDVVLVQGDFGATCLMASLVRKLDGIPVYATTRRQVVERKDGDRVLKTSVFEHVRFREYPVLV